MKLMTDGITDVDSWFEKAPPMGGEKQWRDGRSAKELARYMTEKYPCMPTELEKLLLNFTDADACFDMKAEYVTDLASYGLGRGEGRNHDAFLFGKDVVVGIEGKADESLGEQYVAEAYADASDNKKHRIDGMVDMLYGVDTAPESLFGIRYQLLTASAATLLEANSKKSDTAVLVVLVFKKKGCYSYVKIRQNNDDIDTFLKSMNAVEYNDCYAITASYGKQNGIRFYFKKIEIEVT